MLDIGQRHNVDISIEHLSLNFDKLENIHYGLLKKFQEGKGITKNLEDIISPIKSAGTDIIKQNLPDDGFDRLQALKTAFHHETHNLKKLLAGSFSNTRPITDAETLRICQNQVESNVESLKTRILAAPEVKEAGKTLFTRVHSLFDLASKDISLTFSYLRPTTETGGIERDSIDRIMDLCHMNSETFNHIGDITSSLKKKIVASYNQMHSSELLYNKEAQLLKTSLDQIKNQLKELEQGNKMQENLKTVMDLVDKSVKIDIEKNKLFSGAKSETENTFKKITNQLMEIMSRVENSGAKNKNLESIAAQEQNHETDFLAHQIVVTPAEKRNLSIPASSTTRISSALSPNLTADLFRKRNNSPNSKLLIDPASKSSTSPSRQNLFSPSPMSTSRKSFINNRGSPLRSSKQKSPKSVNEEEQLRKYIGTVNRMKDDLKECSKNLLRAVNRVIDSSINNERVNKFVLHTLTDSQNSFERLVKELEGVTYQGKFIYPFGNSTNRHSSTENIYKDMKYGFKSQSPTKKTHISSASATDLYNRLNLDEKHIPTSKAELLLWSMQERWRNQEEPHKDIETERNLAPVMDKIEKLVELVETQYERKYTALYAKLGQKEHKLECLEAELAKLKNSKQVVVVSQTNENSRSDNAVIEKKYASLLKEYEHKQELEAKQQEEHQEHIQTLNEKIMELSKLNEKQREAREASAKAESIKIQDNSQNMVEKENKLRQEGEEKLRQLREEFEQKIKKQIEQHNSLVETYKDQIDSLNTEKEVLEKNIEEKQAQIVILSDAIESKEDSNTSQLSALKTEKEAVKKSLEEKQNQITTLSKELEGVRNLNIQLEKELAETKSYVGTLEEATVHVEEQVAKIVALTKEKEDLTKEKEDLQAHLGLLEAGIIDKQEEIVHLREAYETATSKLQDEMTEDAVVLMKERDESREKNREIEKRIRILEGEIERAQEKNSALVEENANVVEAQQEALVKVEELQEQLRVRSGEIKKLDGEIKVLKEENAKIAGEKDLIKQTSTKQEEEISGLKKKLVEETEEIKVLKEENIKIVNEKDLVKQASTKQEEEIAGLKKKLAEIEKNHDMTVSKYQEDLEHAETQNKLTSEKQDQTRLQEKEQIDRLNKDILEKEKEIERVKNQLSEKDQTHQQIVNKLEEEIATLKIRIDTLVADKKTEVERVPSFKNPFEPIKEETNTSPEAQSEERDPFGLEYEGEDRPEKTAFSLANSVVSFEYQTQQGESNVFDRKAQFSQVGEPKLHFRSIENGRIDEESTPKSRSKSNVTPVNLDDRDVSFEADDSEARDQVNPFDKSDVFKHEKTAFSLAGSVVSFEYLTQQGESIMLDAKKGQFSAFKFDNASHIGQKMKEELKALQDQINELKKEKAALEEACEKYVKYKDENSSIEQMHSEIKELKAFLTQKDIEISNFKMISSRASVDAGKAKEEYEKKIHDLSEEVKELKDRKIQFEKSQEIQPQPAELNLKKMSTADFKKEFESFEFSEMNPWKQSQADFSQASFSESQISIDKYKKDNKRLREDRRHLRDENDELRKSIKVFQEQIVSFSEIQKSSSSVVVPNSKDESSEILKIIKDAFAEICVMETLKERTNVKLNNKKEAKESLQAFKKVLQENEEDMLELVKELEEYDRAHDEIEHTKEKLRQKDEEMNRKIADANLILQEGRNRIQEEVDLLEGDMNERLLKTHRELEAIIKDYMIADLNSEVLKVSGVDGFEKTEKMVFACIDVLREYIEIATEVQDNYEKLLAETQEKEPKNVQPNQLGQSQLGHSVSKKSDEEEEMKESLEVPSPLKKKTLKRDNTMDQLRKFLPRSSISESVRPITPDGEETPEPHFPEPQIANIRDVGNQEHVKSLYEQIRVLQDENEKLQEEAKQVDHEFAMLKFVRDDLKAELVEKDDQIKDLEKKLDKAVATLEKNEDKQQLVMEKDHIKSIFVKFMQSAINGQKDAAFELLKMLMSLLKLSEEDQQWLVDTFKKKKKGVFSKLFK